MQRKKQACAYSYVRALNLLLIAQINKSRGYRGRVRRDAELFKLCARSKLPSAAPALHIALRDAMRIDSWAVCGKGSGQGISLSLRLARIASHPRAPQTRSPKKISWRFQGAVAGGQPRVPVPSFQKPFRRPAVKTPSSRKCAFKNHERSIVGRITVRLPRTIKPGDDHQVSSTRILPAFVHARCGVCIEYDRVASKKTDLAVPRGLQDQLLRARWFVEDTLAPVMGGVRRAGRLVVFGMLVL